MKKLLLIILIVSAPVAFYVFYQDAFTAPFTQNIIESSKTTEKYESERMNFSVDVPEGFSVEEDFPALTLSIEDSEIIVIVNGTNFEDLPTYLNWYEQTNQVEITHVKSDLFGKDYASFGSINSERIYFFLVENNIYKISTSSPELYDELDKIARSFKYIPPRNN